MAAFFSDDTLLFLSEAEAAAFAAYAQGKDFDAASLKDKELVKVAKRWLTIPGCPDIALFGRMVAKAADMNVEAAASFAHAISTHKVSNEVEFLPPWMTVKRRMKAVRHIWAARSLIRRPTIAMSARISGNWRRRWVRTPI